MMRYLCRNTGGIIKWHYAWVEAVGELTCSNAGRSVGGPRRSLTLFTQYLRREFERIAVRSLTRAVQLTCAL